MSDSGNLQYNDKPENSDNNDGKGLTQRVGDTEYPITFSGVDDGYPSLSLLPTGAMLFTEAKHTNNEGEPVQSTKTMPDAKEGRSSYSWRRVWVWTVVYAVGFCVSTFLEAWYIRQSMDSRSRGQSWLFNFIYILPDSLVPQSVKNWYWNLQDNTIVGAFDYIFISFGLMSIVLMSFWVSISSYRAWKKDPTAVIVSGKILYPVLHFSSIVVLFAFSVLVGYGLGWNWWYDSYIRPGVLTGPVADRWDYSRPAPLNLARWQGHIPGQPCVGVAGSKECSPDRYTWYGTWDDLHNRVPANIVPTVVICVIAVVCLLAIHMYLIRSKGNPDAYWKPAFVSSSVLFGILAVGLLVQALFAHSIAANGVLFDGFVLLMIAALSIIGFRMQLATYWTCVKRRKAHFEWLAGYEIVVVAVAIIICALLLVFGENVTLEV